MEQGTGNKVTIRVAAEGDAAAVARLLTELNEAVGADGVPPGEDRRPENVIVTTEKSRQRLGASVDVEVTLLAKLDGAAVGLVAVRIVPYLGQDVPFAEVTQLYVAPAQRRRGVGTALLLAAEELARSRGCTSVHVIAARGNADALALYPEAGYEPLYVGFEKFL